MDSPLKAFAIKGGRLFAGFRAPTLENGRAAVLSVSLDYLFGEGRPDQKLFRVPLGNAKGVRDLAPLDDGILILAGPSADGAGLYAIH
jgi:Protein of unknown function (DUF3616)